MPIYNSCERIINTKVKVKNCNGKAVQTGYINDIVEIGYIKAKDSVTKPLTITSIWLVLFIRYLMLYTFMRDTSERSLPILRETKNLFTKLIEVVLYPTSIWYRNRAN